MHNRGPFDALQRAEQAFRPQSQEAWAPRSAGGQLTEYGYYGGSAFSAENSMSVAELSRQLRVCMGEIKELRTELAVERDSRSQAVNAFAKRLKEEIAVDVRSMEHHLQRASREAEASFMQKLSDSEQQRALDRRRLDEAVRLTKVADRSQFDQAEQTRDLIDDLRTRVESSVALCNASRIETTQQLEKERNNMTHRLDVELLRYADLHRQQQQQLTQAKQSVAAEVAEVAKTVRGLVESCWEDRATVLTRSLNEALQGFKSLQEKQGHAVVEMGMQVAQGAKDSKRELQALANDFRDRLVGLESAIPLLAARVDRFERKADAVLETSNKVSALVDVLKEMTDKAAVLAQRSMERAQKVEDTMTDRDDRILQLESQSSQLAGLERLKADAEATRRLVVRLEGQIDSVKQIADRDERLVESMQRNIDASLERADAVEKKAQKVVARVETSEQRLMGFVDRLVAIESSSEKMAAIVERGESGTEAAAQRLATVENRQRMTSEKQDATAKELADRLHGLELRFDSAIESTSRSEAVAVGAKKDLERFEKRLGKLEAGLSNSFENLKETRDAVDAQQKEVAAVRKRAEAWKESFERQEHLLEAKSSDVSTSEGAFHEKLTRAEKRMTQSLEAAEKRAEERADQLSRRLEEVAAKAKSAPEYVPTRTQAPLLDDSVALDIAATRRKCDALAGRVQQLESSSSILEGECARRHELSALRSAVLALETSVQNVQREFRTQLAGFQQQLQQPVRPSSASPAPKQTSVNDSLTSSNPPKLSVTVASAAATAGSPTAVKQASPAAPVAAAKPAPLDSSTKPAGGLSRDAAPEDKTARDEDKASVISGVSSVKVLKASTGGFDSSDSSDDDDIGGERQPTGAPAAPSSSARDPGRPPLRSPPKGGGTVSTPPPQSIVIPRASSEGPKKTPYSDTSGSEKERTPTVVAPAPAAALIPASRSEGESAVATTQRTVDPFSANAPAGARGATQRSDFDDDDDDPDDGSPQPPHAVSAILQTSRGGGSQSEGTSEEFVLSQPASKENLQTPVAQVQRPPAQATSDEGEGVVRSMRKSFVSGDSSSGPERGKTAVPQAEQPSSKKFHVTKTKTPTPGGAAAAARSSFDEDDDDFDDDGAKKSPPSQRSRASRRSYASKRTSDVSLSLDSSRSKPNAQTGNRSQSAGKNEETIEDLEDDDQLAEMLGFIGKKK